MTDKIRQAAEPFRVTFETSDMEATAILVKAIQDAGFKVDERAMRKLVDAPSESPTPASEEELVAALAKQMHHHLSAAQNLAWEEGDTCGDCKDDVRDICIPIIRAYAAERVREAVEAEREACAKVAYKTPFRCHAEDDGDFHSGCVQTRDGIVDAIRSRGDKEGT